MAGIEAHFDASEVNELAADLAGAPARAQAGSITVLGEVAEQVGKDARRFAPVLTGRLRDSIDVTVHGLLAEVTASTPYADYVEYGTSDTRPQPYMRPAADLAYGRLADGLGDVGEAAVLGGPGAGLGRALEFTDTHGPSQFGWPVPGDGF